MDGFVVMVQKGSSIIHCSFLQDKEEAITYFTDLVSEFFVTDYKAPPVAEIERLKKDALRAFYSKGATWYNTGRVLISLSETQPPYTIDLLEESY